MTVSIRVHLTPNLRLCYAILRHDKNNPLLYYIYIQRPGKNVSLCYDTNYYVCKNAFFNDKNVNKGWLWETQSKVCERHCDKRDYFLISC